MYFAHDRSIDRREHAGDWYDRQSPGFTRKRQNVGATERFVSGLGGAGLVMSGLRRRGVGGILMALGGAALLKRAVSGRCEMYRALGISTAKDARGYSRSGSEGSRFFNRGIHVEESITIQRPVEEVYRFWRRFENLPRFMDHLQSVEEYDALRSRWVAKAPAGTNVEWDAEIINEEPNRLIAWKSLPGADVDNRGSVRFLEARGGSGCEVRVTLDYIPPAGRLGSIVARLFGEEPGAQIREDLRKLRQLLEAGEIATIEGQPSGREHDAARAGERQAGPTSSPAKPDFGARSAPEQSTGGNEPGQRGGI